MVVLTGRASIAELHTDAVKAFDKSGIPRWGSKIENVAWTNYVGLQGVSRIWWHNVEVDGKGLNCV